MTGKNDVHCKGKLPTACRLFKLNYNPDDFFWTSCVIRVPEGQDPDTYETDSEGKKKYRREAVNLRTGETIEFYVPESGWIASDETGVCYKFDEKIGLPIPTNTVSSVEKENITKN